MTTRCQSCDAPIRFVPTAKGKSMPLDLEPTEKGNVQIGLVGGEEIAIVLGPADRASAQVDGIPLYTSHHFTCPEGEKWRR